MEYSERDRSELVCKCTVCVCVRVVLCGDGMGGVSWASEENIITNLT